MTSPIPLRERLAAEIRQPFTAEDSRAAGNGGSEQVLAGRMLVVFRDWLREHEQELAESRDFWWHKATGDQAGFAAPEEIHRRKDNSGRAEIGCNTVRELADAIDKELNQ